MDKRLDPFQQMRAWNKDGTAYVMEHIKLSDGHVIHDAAVGYFDHEWVEITIHEDDATPLWVQWSHVISFGLVTV